MAYDHISIKQLANQQQNTAPALNEPTVQTALQGDHLVLASLGLTHFCWGFPGGSVKSPPAMQETWVQSQGQEYSLEKGMATQFSTLPWRIPWKEEPGGLQSMGWQ